MQTRNRKKRSLEESFASNPSPERSLPPTGPARGRKQAKLKTSKKNERAQEPVTPTSKSTPPKNKKNHSRSRPKASKSKKNAKSSESKPNLEIKSVKSNKKSKIKAKTTSKASKTVKKTKSPSVVKKVKKGSKSVKKTKPKKEQIIQSIQKPLSKTAMKKQVRVASQVDDIISQRLRYFPNESLIRFQDGLYCQCCAKFVTTHRGDLGDHLARPKHVNKLRAWRDGARPQAPPRAGDVREDSILAACMVGIPSKRICRYNELIQSKHQFPNGAGLVQSDKTFTSKIRETKMKMKEILSPLFDRNKPFSLIVDECDDTSCPGGLVNILYNADPRKKSICIESIFIETSLNATELVRILNDVITANKFKTQHLNGVHGDSTEYVVSAFEKLKEVYTFMTAFPDASHLLALPLKDVLFDDKEISNEFDCVYKWIIETNKYFTRSKEKKNDFRNNLKERELDMNEVEAALGEFYYEPEEDLLEEMLQDDGVADIESKNDELNESKSGMDSNDIDIQSNNNNNNNSNANNSDITNNNNNASNSNIVENDESNANELELDLEAAEGLELDLEGMEANENAKSSDNKKEFKLKQYYFNCLPFRLVQSRWESAYYCLQYHIINLDFEINYFENKCNAEHVLRSFEASELKAKMMFLYATMHPTFILMKWFQGYGTGAHEIFDKLENIKEYYNQKINYASFSCKIYDNISDSTITSDHFKKQMQLVYDYFKDCHKKHFSRNELWMCYYENCRNFNPNNNNKADTVAEATKFLPFGYYAYTKKIRVQEALKKAYAKYVSETENMLAKVDDPLAWWEQRVVSKEYVPLNQVATRALTVAKGGCDVERSYNYYSELCRLFGSASMAPVTKETRVMAHWNKEEIAKMHFGVEFQ